MFFKTDSKSARAESWESLGRHIVVLASLYETLPESDESRVDRDHLVKPLARYGRELGERGRHLSEKLEKGEEKSAPSPGKLAAGTALAVGSVLHVMSPMTLAETAVAALAVSGMAVVSSSIVSSAVRQGKKAAAESAATLRKSLWNTPEDCRGLHAHLKTNDQEFQRLTGMGIGHPNLFGVTKGFEFREFLEQAGSNEKLREALQNAHLYAANQGRGAAFMGFIDRIDKELGSNYLEMAAGMPRADLEEEMSEMFQKQKEKPVGVRPS